MPPGKAVLALLAALLFLSLLPACALAQDTTRPVMGSILISPSNPSPSQPFTITVTATDNDAVSSVDMYIYPRYRSGFRTLLHTCTASPPSNTVTCTYSHPGIPIAGVYKFQTEAFDRTGNNAQNFKTITVGNDVTPPVATITHGSTTVGPGGPVFTITASDDIAVNGFTVFFDGNPVPGNVFLYPAPVPNPPVYYFYHDRPPWRFPAIYPGTHTYSVQVEDTSTNVVTSQAGTFTMPSFSDTVSPVITSISVVPGTSIVTGQGVVFSAAATDDNAVLKIELEVRDRATGNMVVYRPCFYAIGTMPISSSAQCTSAMFFFSSPITLDFIAKAYDTSYNLVQSSTTTVTVVADTQLPSGSISHSPNFPVAGQNVRFTATGQDNGDVSQIDIFVDGLFLKCCGSKQQCGSVIPSSNPPPCIYDHIFNAPGTHTYEVRVWDGALNNWTSAQKVFVVSPDSTPPTITKAMHSFPGSGVAAPVGTGGNPFVTIDAEATDDVGVSAVYIYIDGQSPPVKTCTYSPAVLSTPTCTYTGQVTPGPHTYEVIAVDTSNNQARTGPMAMSADSIPPHVTMSLSSGSTVLIAHVPHLIQGMANPTSPQGTPVSVQPKTQLTFRADAQDETGLSRIDIVVGGAAVKSCTISPCTHTMSLTAQGLYQFHAEAFDTSGNRGETENSFFYVGTSSQAPPSAPPSATAPVPTPSPVQPAAMMTCTCRDLLCSSLTTGLTTSPGSTCSGWCRVLGQQSGANCDSYTATQVTPGSYSCRCETSACQSIPPASMPSVGFSPNCMNYCMAYTRILALQSRGSFCVY